MKKNKKNNNKDKIITDVIKEENKNNIYDEKINEISELYIGDKIDFLSDVEYYVYIRDKYKYIIKNGVILFKMNNK